MTGDTVVRKGRVVRYRRSANRPRRSAVTFTALKCSNNMVGPLASGDSAVVTTGTNRADLTMVDTTVGYNPVHTAGGQMAIFTALRTEYRNVIWPFSGCDIAIVTACTAIENRAMIHL